MPLISQQELLNAALSASGTALVVGNGDATIFRVSSFGGGFGYTNISTSAQNVVKSGAGILGVIALNGTLVSAIRGYDNTVSGGNILFTIPAATAASTFSYNVRFNTGLVVSTGAAADNITVMYN